MIECATVRGTQAATETHLRQEGGQKGLLQGGLVRRDMLHGHDLLLPVPHYLVRLPQVFQGSVEERTRKRVESHSLLRAVVAEAGANCQTSRCCCWGLVCLAAGADLVLGCQRQEQRGGCGAQYQATSSCDLHHPVLNTHGFKLCTHHFCCSIHSSSVFYIQQRG